jgi:hypothetical protein
MPLLASPRTKCSPWPSRIHRPRSRQRGPMRLRTSPLSKTAAFSRFSRRPASRFTFLRQKTENCGSFGRPRQGAHPDEVMRCCAPAGLRVGGGSARSKCPLVKIETGQHPPFSPPTGAALVHRLVHFSPSFLSARHAQRHLRGGVTAAGRLGVRFSHWTIGRCR